MSIFTQIRIVIIFWRGSEFLDMKAHQHLGLLLSLLLIIPCLLMPLELLLPKFSKHGEIGG